MLNLFRHPIGQADHVSLHNYILQYDTQDKAAQLTLRVLLLRSLVWNIQ